MLWLSALVLAWAAMEVNGHAYMYWPTSRQYMRDQRHMHSNGGEKQGAKGITSQFGGGPDLRGGKKIPADRFAWDICGTNIEGDSWGLIDDVGEPLTTYKQGGKITFIIVVNGEHGGLYDFRLCPKKIDSKMSAEEAGRCLDTYLIGRTCVTSDDCETEDCKSGCGCGDDKCRDFTPHRTKDDPIFTQNGEYREPYHLEHGAHKLTFQLPKDLHCEHCTIQWYWATAYNENFRGCADVKIEKSGGGGGGGEEGGRRRKDGSPVDEKSRRRRSKDEGEDRRRRRSKDEEGGSRRRRSKDDEEGSRRRRSKDDGGSRRRRSKDEEGGSRRRRSKDDDGGSRRRRSTRRRKDACSDAAADRTVAAKAAPAEFAVDMEYEKVGCFPLSKGDAAAEELKCECDTGDGPRTTDTLRDYTCAKHDGGSEGGPCRSGLPFYRLHMDKSVAVGLCFRFCSSKGLDLFGLVGDIECRCGATYANSKFWGYVEEPPKGLILDTTGTKLNTCSADSVHVYRYIGWMRYEGADGVQKAMLDLGPTDQEYIASIIKGAR